MECLLKKYELSGTKKKVICFQNVITILQFMWQIILSKYFHRYVFNPPNNLLGVHHDSSFPQHRGKDVKLFIPGHTVRQCSAGTKT